MDTLRLTLAFACVLAACTSDPPARKPEPRPEPNEGGTPEPTCSQLQAELRVLEERASCETSAQCTVLGSCSASDWRVVASRDATAGLQLHAEMSDACGTTADGPLPHAECVEGQCELIGADFETATEICGLGPIEDAGPDANEGGMTRTCEGIAAELEALEAQATCDDVSDCELLGDCGDANWDAVAASDATAARALRREGLSLGCSGGFDGPIPSLECRAGMCVVGDWIDDCGGFDAGSDDAGP